MKLFPQANYNTMKAIYKLHLGLDHKGFIRAFANVTLGKESDMSGARIMDFKKSSVVVFDKGYNDYTWHNTLTKKGIYFDTRIRRNAVYKVLERRPYDPNYSVTSDQTIMYSTPQAKDRALHSIRRVGYKDPITGKQYFLLQTNLSGRLKRLLKLISKDVKSSYFRLNRSVTVFIYYGIGDA